MRANWKNTDVWSIGKIDPYSNINPGQCLSFSVTPSAPTRFETVTYSKQSYIGQGPQNASVRMSPAGLDQITFNISSMPITSSAEEVRIYFFNGTGQD